jgi:hypothetical protein
MKKVFLLFLVILIFFVFSCKGTPKSDEGAPDLSQSDLIEESQEPGILENELLDRETLSEGVTDIDETDLTEEPLLAGDSASAGSDAQESAVGAAFEEEILPPADRAATAPVPAGPSAAETPPAPAVETAAPLPVAETAPAPVSEPAPVQRQPPPVPPPALLGPAEERPSAVVRVPDVERPPVQERQGAERESVQDRQSGVVPFRSEPPAVSAARDDSLPVRPGMVASANEEIIFSRIVRATVGQLVEIPFRGIGWIFLGELASRRGIAYDSSRRDPEGQSIIFRAEEAGTYVLKFYKRDHIRDYFLNDYVQVIVGEAPTSGAGWFNPPADRGRVAANPRWPSALEEAEILRSGASGSRPSAGASAAGESASSGTSSIQGTAAAQGATPAQGTASTQGTTPAQTAPIQPPLSVNEPPASAALSAEDVPEKQEILTPDEIFKKAQETFNGGNIPAAIALLDQFSERYPSGSDELYWLYGQFYEANTPYRNILLSLDNYRRLVREYPQSSRLNDARRRIAYLERFYINIQ